MCSSRADRRSTTWRRSPRRSTWVGLAGGKPVLVVLNGVPPRGPKVDQARDVLESLGVQACPVALGHRVAFDHAGALGLSAQEYESGGKAASEVVDMYVSVMQRENLSTGKGGG